MQYVDNLIWIFNNIKIKELRFAKWQGQINHLGYIYCMWVKEISF